MVQKIEDFKIESERIVLVPISQEYKEVIFREFTDEITLYMFPSTPKEISETEEFIRATLEKVQKKEEIVTVILKKENSEFLGCCGLHRIDTKTPEIGIWLKKGAHGYKYGQEAIHALKDWADKNIDYDYLIYPVVKENTASRRVPESLGGELVRSFEKANQSGLVRGMVEYFIYSDKK